MHRPRDHPTNDPLMFPNKEVFKEPEKCLIALEQNKEGEILCFNKQSNGGPRGTEGPLYLLVLLRTIKGVKDTKYPSYESLIHSYETLFHSILISSLASSVKELMSMIV